MTARIWPPRPQPPPEPEVTWEDSALCAQADPEAFFPEGGSVVRAKKVCERCQVRIECLKFALDHDMAFGIWGGTSELERRFMRRQQAAA